MSLENIRAVEGLFCRGSRPRAETTYHRTLVVGKSVAIFVVFSCEALDVVIASLNGAFLWTLILVSEHVRLQIFENLSAVWV